MSLGSSITRPAPCRGTSPVRVLAGGRELQRCLYAFAVQSLLGEDIAVEAALLYPRGEDAYYPLPNPKTTLDDLKTALQFAVASLRAGRALPGPDTGGDYDDLAFALPAREGARLDPKTGSGPRASRRGRDNLGGTVTVSIPVAPAGLRERDTAARLRALTDLDSTLLVEAGAGSGKTSVLAGRIVMLLASGRSPTEIAAITFTEAAASELRQRVEDFVADVLRGTTPIQLQLAWPDGPTVAQRQSLSAGAAELDALVCTTIHGFCRLLLTPYPVEARIDPGAAIADQDAAGLIFEDVLRDFLHTRLSGDADADDPVAALFLGDENRPEDLIAGSCAESAALSGGRIDVYASRAGTPARDFVRRWPNSAVS